MVYSNKMVVSVVTSAGIAREIRQAGTDSVYIPFGSDYSIRFKNLDSRRAVVSIEVDGENALDGSKIVVGANETGELEGFMEGSTVRKMFRFIEKTEQISEHRGDRMDDGLIRVSWQFERSYRPQTFLRGRQNRRRGIMGPAGYAEDSASYDEAIGESLTKSTLDEGSLGIMDGIRNCISDQGITVPGADTHQHFNSTHIGALEADIHVVVIELRGKKSQGEIVTAPLVTRKKYRCPTCGDRNSSSAKFCPGCGTNLT